MPDCRLNLAQVRQVHRGNVGNAHTLHKKIRKHGSRHPRRIPAMPRHRREHCTHANYRVARLLVASWEEANAPATLTSLFAGEADGTDNGGSEPAMCWGLETPATSGLGATPASGNTTASGGVTAIGPYRCQTMFTNARVQQPGDVPGIWEAANAPRHKNTTRCCDEMCVCVCASETPCPAIDLSATWLRPLHLFEGTPSPSLQTLQCVVVELDVAQAAVKASREHVALLAQAG